MELPDRSPEGALTTLDGAGVGAAMVSISGPGVFHGDARAAVGLAGRRNPADSARSPRRHRPNPRSGLN